MHLSLIRFSRKTIVSLFLVLFLIPVAAVAEKKETNPGQGVGSIDVTQYNCPEGMGASECMLLKMDRIERRLGCPIDEYLDDSCPYSPADATATFCITQGREGGLDVEFGLETNVEIELGGGWPNAIWGKGTGKVEAPFAGFIPGTPIPFALPTELNVTGAASLGRNFNICIDIPLVAFAEAVGIEDSSDEEIIDDIVRAINSPKFNGQFEKSKFQRRLGRLANYAKRKVPDAGFFAASSVQTNASIQAALQADNNETEFDLVEDAIERLMAGDFGINREDGLMAVMNSTVINDLRTALEVPESINMVLDDPNILITNVIERGMAAAGRVQGVSFCEAVGINSDLKFENNQVDSFCTLLDGLPAFSKTVGIFSIVDSISIIVSNIRNTVRNLPLLADIQGCGFWGWTFSCKQE